MGEFVKLFEEFVNESSLFPDRAWHIKFGKANDKDAIKMLKAFYGDEIMGEDFYPGPGTDKTMELSNDKLVSLFDKGLIVAIDPDDFTYKVAESEEHIDEASFAGRAWSGKIANLDNLFSWFYDKGILNKGEQAKKDSLFRQYYRYYNDGDFPKGLSSKGISKYHGEEKIERALEDEIENFMKQILNKYTGTYDRKLFHLDTLLADLYTLRGVVAGRDLEGGVKGEPDPYGLLNYWGKKVNVKDSEFEKMLGELRPLYDDARKAVDTAVDKEVKNGIYKDKKSYEIPGPNNGISWVRQKMEGDGIWTPDLEKRYQKMKTHMMKMSDILNTVIEGAEKVKSELGS